MITELILSGSALLALFICAVVLNLSGSVFNFTY